MEVIFLFHVLYCDFLRHSSANPKDVSWDIETKPAGVAVRCSHFKAAKHQNVWTHAKFLLSTRGEGGLARSQCLGSQLHLKSGRQPQRSVAAVTPQNCCSAALICSWLFFLSFFFFAHKLHFCQLFQPGCQSALSFLSRPNGTRKLSSRAAFPGDTARSRSASVAFTLLFLVHLVHDQLYFHHLPITPGIF